MNGNRFEGAAYVFNASNGNWAQQAELTPGNNTALDYFGAAVALSTNGDTALISIGGSDNRQGAAYTFTDNNNHWTQQAELRAGDGTAGDGFGFSMALSSDGSVVLIAASQKTIGSNNDQGASYIFNAKNSHWSQQAELVASDGAKLDLFGQSVALSANGDIVLIGAFYKKTKDNLEQGAVYAFMRSTK